MEYDKMIKVAEIKVYNSPEEYAEYLSNIPDYYHGSYKNENGPRAWGGAETYKEAIEILNGSIQYTKNEDKVNSIIEQMQIEGLFTTGIKLPERAYWGNTVNIPAYLAGLPKNMKRRIPSENSALNTPINIYLETFVSAGLSDQQIANRGIACAAFVMAMQSVRPVNLYATNIGGAACRENNIYGTVVKLFEGTIDTSRLLFAMSNRTFCRRLGFTAFRHIIDKEYDPINPPNEYEDIIREYLGLTNEDIYIVGGYLYDNHMLNNPIQWVKDMVEKHKYLEATE